MLTKEEKGAAVARVRVHDSDTGSSVAQVGILTTRIQRLGDHLQKNRKDKHSRRGLIRMVERRRKHLSYLKRKHADIYEGAIKTLGLRR